MFTRKTVYAIKHIPTGKIYVGSTKNVKLRVSAHMNALNRGDHIVPEMQSDHDIFGNDYSVSILDEIVEYEQKTKEYEWMVRLRTYDPRFGYNMHDHKDFQKMLKEVKF